MQGEGSSKNSKSRIETQETGSEASARGNLGGLGEENTFDLEGVVTGRD